MDSANETQRAVYVDRCAELISCAGETVRTVMANSWASSLGLKIAQYKDILKPYLEKRRSKSAINTQRIDVDDFLIAYDPEKIPEYVEENEEYKKNLPSLRLFSTPEQKKANRYVICSATRKGDTFRFLIST